MLVTAMCSLSSPLSVVVSLLVQPAMKVSGTIIVLSVVRSALFDMIGLVGARLGKRG